MKQLRPEDYHIGWVCPLKVEYLAAKCMLDELHEGLAQPDSDHNVYELGEIHKHNVVLCRLSTTGNTITASSVTHMKRTFPNLKFALLVGIGGGVPTITSNGEIRLGHVIVGKPTGNAVVKDAYLRDTLSSKDGIICFEMEAAGALTSIECLVVRGISDYCDSHKNDRWQGYASINATAFAREVLKKLPIDSVKQYQSGWYSAHAYDEFPAADSRGDLQDLSTQVQELKVSMETGHRKYESKSILDWLCPSDTSGIHNNALESHHAGTGEWIFNHESYISWITTQGSFLWLSGRLGSGKTTLVSYIANHLACTGNRVVYHYFRLGDASERGAYSDMLRSLCAQLFTLTTKSPAISMQKVYVGRVVGLEACKTSFIHDPREADHEIVLSDDLGPRSVEKRVPQPFVPRLFSGDTFVPTWKVLNEAVYKLTVAVRNGINMILQLAAFHECLDLILFCLLNGADPNIGLLDNQSDGCRNQSLLSKACSQGWMDIIRLLLQKKAGRKELVRPRDWPLYALCRASKMYSEEEFLSLFFEIESAGFGMDAALCAALIEEDDEVAQMLTRLGANIHGTLKWAMKWDNCEPALEAGARWNNAFDLFSFGDMAEKADLDPDLALASALQADNTSCILILLGRGGRLSRSDSCGDSILLVAARQGLQNDRDSLFAAAAYFSWPAIQSLLMHNRRLNWNQRPISVLHITALYSPSPNIIKQMSAFGGNPSARDMYGNDLFHLAALNKSTEILQYLLSAQVTLNNTNKDGDTPLDVARRYGRQDTADLLIAAGAQARQDSGAQGSASALDAYMPSKNGEGLAWSETQLDEALRAAIDADHRECIRLLEAHGARLERSTQPEQSADDDELYCR
ncbi:hypothetical protein KVT40_007728 [Elsinoe batatas]|uniref:Nephrocystin 3-like N-terminal domain-containing protein n=1 Tax=Elsinoe batatas TaxID=2601811 RepID=A0A8K0PCJ8_9PEZI|nr:hypothetical protein KVT40_007728 [Elsinoe batatas]